MFHHEIYGVLFVCFSSLWLADSKSRNNAKLLLQTKVIDRKRTVTELQMTCISSQSQEPQET